MYKATLAHAAATAETKPPASQDIWLGETTDNTFTLTENMHNIH